MERFRLSLKDIRPFFGKDLPNEVFDISASVRVNRNRITIPNLRVAERERNVLLRAKIDFENTQRFFVDLKELKVKQEFVNSIASSLEVNESIGNVVKNIGDVNISADILRRTQTKVNAKIGTGIGTGDVAMSIDENKCIDARIISPNIDIGKLVSNEDWGKADFNAEASVKDQKIFLKVETRKFGI